MGTENESVLSIYLINSSRVYDYADFLKIWDDFVAAKVPDVSCREIINFSVSVNELYDSITSRNFSQDTYEILKSEFEIGANVVFIQPVVGKPIGGFFLSKLVSIN